MAPADIITVVDYAWFTDPIEPLWEDEANRSGGKWILRLKKGFSPRYWEGLLLAMVGEQVPGHAPGAGVGGAVLMTVFWRCSLGWATRYAARLSPCGRTRISSRCGIEHRRTSTSGLSSSARRTLGLGYAGFWPRSPAHPVSRVVFREKMLAALELPPSTVMEYKEHDTSLRDRTSFRNTDVFK